MKETCRLCNMEKELRNSHILPEFMYQNLYDPNPRRFYTLTVDFDDPKKSSKKYHQKGIREKLFCQECESKLSKYENYAAETIYGKNRKNNAYIVKASETPNQQYFLYQYAGFSYKEFKIFLLSILYRILISTSFYAPKVPDEIIEKLRIAIESENPLEYDDFGCLLQIIMYKKSQIADGFILYPFLTQNKNSEILNILVDGFMYSFYLNSKNISGDIKKNFLKKDGTMNIVGRVIFQDKGLFERVKKACDFFKFSKKK